MRGAGDIAGISIPFVTGTAIVLYGYSIQEDSHIPISAITVCIFLCCSALLHPLHKKAGTGTLRVIIIMLASLCGMMNGISGKLLSISGSMFPDTISTIAADFSQKIKSAIDQIQFGDNQTSAIIKALVTGDRRSLTSETISAFRDSGAAHILALSGMHLSIIYGILNRILSITGNSRGIRWSRALVVVSSCGFYTLATGAGPSITRAFLFILIGETAVLTGRFRNIGNILLSALLLQILHDPLSMKSISFQLSYAAMAGIAWIYPHIKRMWPQKTENKGIIPSSLGWMWNSAAMSIACQLTTGPLAYLYFGTFPKHFLLTNLIALPVSGIIIPLSLLTIISEVADIQAEPLKHLTEILITFLMDSLKTISSM